MLRPRLGDFVYPHARPLQAGKIIGIEPSEPYANGKEGPPKLTIKRPSGAIYTADANTVHLYRRLYLDAEQKMKTHLAMLDKLEAME